MPSGPRTMLQTEVFFLETSRIPSILRDVSTALVMSYKVNAATETAGQGSISTPVLATTVTDDLMRTMSGVDRSKSTTT